MSLTDLAQTSQSWAQRTHQPHPRPEGVKTENQVPAFPSAADGLATGRNVRRLQAFPWPEWEEKPKPPALRQLASSEPGGQHGVPSILGRGSSPAGEEKGVLPRGDTRWQFLKARGEGASLRQVGAPGKPGPVCTSDLAPASYPPGPRGGV